MFTSFGCFILFMNKKVCAKNLVTCLKHGKFYSEFRKCCIWSFITCLHIPKSDTQWRLGVFNCKRKLKSIEDLAYVYSNGQIGILAILITKLSASYTASNNSQRTETEVRYESLTTENTVYSSTLYQSCFYHRSPLRFRSIAHSLCPNSGSLSVFYVRKERDWTSIHQWWLNYFFTECGDFPQLTLVWKWLL